MSNNPILDLEAELRDAHGRLPTIEAVDRADAETDRVPPTKARDAIRRRRPWRSAPLIAGAFVVCGAAAAAVVLTGQRSLPPSGPLPPIFGRGAFASNRYRIELTPDLATGQIAWCTTLELLENGRATLFGSGGCSGRDGPLAAPSITLGEPGATLLFDVLTPNVAAVRASGSRLLLLPAANPALPRGWKVAVAAGHFAAPTIVPYGHHKTPTRPLGPQQLPTLIPLDASLKPLPIRSRGVQTIKLPVRAVDPLRPPPEGCSIRVLPLRGLTVVGETVLRDAPPAILEVGEHAYLSCASVELKYHHQPVIAALLLDAQHPGARPSPLPDTQPLSGIPGTYAGPGAEEVGFMRFGFDETAVLTARRVGNAWLVLQGPRDTHQRQAIASILRPRL